MRNKIKVIDLFCGVGGLSYGFAHDDNFEIVVANEILPNMAKAYELNHPLVKVYNKDIKNFGITDLEQDFGIQSGEIDLVIGGPPCQAYSTVGKRLADDPRGQLFQEYYRVLKEISPRAFIFENVKGLLSMQKGELMKTILGLFKSLGFEVQYKVLNAADYGTPQVRERVIIVGTKTEKRFEFPKPTHYNPLENSLIFNTDLKPYISVAEAIGDLPFIRSGEECFEYSTQPQNEYQRLMREKASEILNDHNAPNNNENLVRLMELLPDGGSPLDLPKELRPKSGFANTYCRLWWDRPSTTITRNLSTPSSSRCIHPKAPRPLTTREGARLQGFPDHYQFFGSRSDKNLQIGNAVPTFLSEKLKEQMKKIFESDTEIQKILSENKKMRMVV